MMGLVALLWNFLINRCYMVNSQAQVSIMAWPLLIDALGSISNAYGNITLTLTVCSTGLFPLLFYAFIKMSLELYSPQWSFIYPFAIHLSTAISFFIDVGSIALLGQTVQLCAWIRSMVLQWVHLFVNCLCSDLMERRLAWRMFYHLHRGFKGRLSQGKCCHC